LAKRHRTHRCHRPARGL
jgi:hypothetical protein